MRKIVVCCFCILYLSILGHSISSAANERDMTNAQRAEMFEICLALQDQWDALDRQYSPQVSSEDCFLSAMLYDRLYDLHLDADWQTLRQAMDACISTEDFVGILHGDFVGITQAPPHEPQRNDLVPKVEAILQTAGHADLPARAYMRMYANTHPWYTSPSWYVSAGETHNGRASRSDWPHILLGLTEDGRLTSLETVDYPENPLQPPVEVSDVQWRERLNQAIRFVNGYAVTDADELREVEGFHRTLGGLPDDPYLTLYVFYGANSSTTTSFPAMQKLGYEVRIGLHSGKIYGMIPTAMDAAD